MSSLTHDIPTWNGNLDLVVNIVTATLGISFPFILQAINNIDEKYHSQTIISLFVERMSYILFRQLLFVAVLLLFAITLLPFTSISNDILDQFQTFENILCGCLVLILFWLASDILLFYRADQFISVFKDRGEYLYRISNSIFSRDIPGFQRLLRSWYNNGSRGELIKAWSEYVSFLIASEKGDLARDAFTFLAVRIARLRESANGEVEYNEDINNAVVKLNTDLCRSQIKAFSIFSQNDLLVMYSGQSDDKENGKSIRYIIWRCLSEQLYYDRDEMVFAHWRYASQRMRLYLDDYLSGKSHNPVYIKTYKRFYLVLCANVLLNQKYDLLANILFFSHNTPPDYPLLPQNYGDLFTWYSEFNASGFEDNFSIEAEFPTIGDMQKPGDTELRKACTQFVALLILRLDYIRDYLVTRNRFLEPILEKETPRYIHQQIETQKSIIASVQEWLAPKNSKLIASLMRNGYESENKVESFLQDCLRNMETKEKQIYETQQISPQIVSGMQDVIRDAVEKRINLYRCFLNSSTTLPDCDYSNMQEVFNAGVAYYEASSYQLHPKEYFKEDQLVPIINFPETIAEGMKFELSHGITMQFYIRDYDTINILESELTQALDILKPDKDKHVILCFGIGNLLEMNIGARVEKCDDGSYRIDDIETWCMPYSQHYNNKILIVRKDTLPKLTIETASEKRQNLWSFQRISDAYPILWSLQDPNSNGAINSMLLSDGSLTVEALKDKMVLYVYLAYKFYVPENCILTSLTLCSPFGSEKSKIDKLKQL